MGCASTASVNEKPFNYEIFVKENGEKTVKYKRASWMWPNSTVYYSIDHELLS